jgi:hypothetical protein
VRGAYGAKFLRIEQQISLQTFHRIEHDHRDNAEEKHRDRIFRPAHFVVLIDASDSIEQPLDRAERRVHESFLAVEYAGHENAQRLRDRQDQREEKRDLKPAVRSHQNFSGRRRA